MVNVEEEHDLYVSIKNANKMEELREDCPWCGGLKTNYKAHYKCWI